MNHPTVTIEAFAKCIPSALLARSGKVFYSGRSAFSAPFPLYVLGLNPGGAPVNYRQETIEAHTALVLEKHAADWSAYRDESWEGAAPGTYGMAPRVLHLFGALGFSPGSVPCSNLIFARSSREAEITHEVAALAHLCWPFHALALSRLQPRAVLCFGKSAGSYVRAKIGASTLCAEFVETNNRRWRSQLYTNSVGLRVVVATHPSIADWRAKSTDPTPLIREALQ
jgi:hypothetical protein